MSIEEVARVEGNAHGDTYYIYYDTKKSCVYVNEGGNTVAQITARRSLLHPRRNLLRAMLIAKNVIRESQEAREASGLPAAKRAWALVNGGKA